MRSISFSADFPSGAVLIAMFASLALTGCAHRNAEANGSTRTSSSDGSGDGKGGPYRPTNNDPVYNPENNPGPRPKYEIVAPGSLPRLADVDLFISMNDLHNPSNSEKLTNYAIKGGDDGEHKPQKIDEPVISIMLPKGFLPDSSREGKTHHLDVTLGVCGDKRFDIVGNRDLKLEIPITFLYRQRRELPYVKTPADEKINKP